MNRKGRGAVSNDTGRFERYQYVGADDAPPNERVATTVTPDTSRTILAKNDSPDVPFSTSINPYRGCEHGCVYCFARPTHAFLGLSPGLDFETKIFSKPNAAELLRDELAKKSYVPTPLAIGANTDPYQPAEREHRITRSLLEVLEEHRHPLSIVTKSDLVLRDVDILERMAAERLASVFVSITTLDPDLARTMEPRAAVPERRLAAVRALSEKGIPCGVLISPMIPALNDAELESIVEASAKAGARSAGYILVRLPLELKTLFTEWLETHYPDKASHVLNLLRESREGELYRSGFGERMRGTGVHADLLERRFRVSAKRWGLDGRLEPLDVSRFRRPVRPGGQYSLFEDDA